MTSFRRRKDVMCPVGTFLYKYVLCLYPVDTQPKINVEIKLFQRLF